MGTFRFVSHRTTSPLRRTGKFSYKAIKLISTSKKHWILCINFGNFGIHTFHAHMNFAWRYCFPVIILKVACVVNINGIYGLIF